MSEEKIPRLKVPMRDILFLIAGLGFTALFLYMLIVAWGNVL